MKNFKILFLLLLSFVGVARANELHDAARDNDIKKIKKLINNGVNMYSLDSHGYIPLFQCTTKEAAQCFINSGVDVNYSNNSMSMHGWTLLHSAIEANLSNNFILYLLDCGADLRAESICHGKISTPLSMFFEPHYELLNNESTIKVIFPTLNLTVINDTTPEDFFNSVVKARALLEARSQENAFYVEAEFIPGRSFEA